MIVLGIDPGTARLGYGVVRKEGSRLEHVAHGCVETPKIMPQAARLSHLHKALSEVIAAYQPTLAGIEKLFFQKNAKTAMTVSEARGVALLVLNGSGMMISEFTPMQIKLAATGWGSADKKQVQEMVKRLLSLKEIPKPDDAADALAIAYCTAVSIVDAKRPT